VVVCLLAVADLSTGTSPHFVLMMSVAVSSACVTYNLLGGVGTISGIGFAGFAGGTLLVSQIGKAILFERPDQGLNAPELTISVYAVYYFSLLVGTFLFARLRLPLPKPAEPETSSQSRNLYLIALVVGSLANLELMIASLAGGSALISVTHGISRALAYLLPLSVVLAVDDRIRSTDGKHFFGWLAFWPTLGMELQGFLSASRGGFVTPIALIFLTCFLRNFRFKRRDYAMGSILGIAFFAVVSPYYLYSRAWRNGPSLTETATRMIQVAESAPSQWVTIQEEVSNSATANPDATNYFNAAWAVTLNRFALIGPDSTLINACSTGFHYGFTSIKLDFFSQIPRFLYPSKPETSSATYLGQLDGQESDLVETTAFSTITPVSDSFGGFGWLGVVAFPLLVMPAVFAIYESMFDIRKPWGTVATVLLGFGIAGGSMGGTITETLIKTPLYILILSSCAVWVVRMIPASGDRIVVIKRLDKKSPIPRTIDGQEVG
jgi:hypothetical protein